MSAAFLSRKTVSWLAGVLAWKCNYENACPAEGECPFLYGCKEITREDWQEVLKAIPLYTQEKQEKKK